jgi:transposase IS116/IS110/IS902 family protein
MAPPGAEQNGSIQEDNMPSTAYPDPKLSPLHETKVSPLKTLKAQLAELNHDIDDTVKRSPVWRVANNLLTSLQGVGDVTAHTLIADLPELGQLDRRGVAAVVGAAPVDRDPGQMRCKRTIAGGRLTFAKLCTRQRALHSDGTALPEDLPPRLPTHFDQWSMCYRSKFALIPTARSFDPHQCPIE